MTESALLEISQSIHLVDDEFVAHAGEDIPKLIAEVRKLKALLARREVQWGEIEGIPLGDEGCPVCFQPRCPGHTQTCPIGEALK